MADLVTRITMRKRLVAIHEPRRRAKSMDYLKESVARLTKSDVGMVKIDAKLNEFMMLSPARRMKGIEVKISKDANSIKVSLLNAQAQKPQAKSETAKQQPAAHKAAEPKKLEAKKEAGKPAAAEEKAPKPAEAQKKAQKEDTDK